MIGDNTKALLQLIRVDFIFGTFKKKKTEIAEY